MPKTIDQILHHLLIHHIQDFQLLQPLFCLF
nr:MAG TPA: hypothetical protein [Caudoviricetes sp.]DAT10104.1 MAG TPA: hypothetical protein [Caudoviricetes sp.]